MTSKECELLADLLYPNIKGTIDDLEKKFPPRILPDGAIVTRAAPSPTGDVHLGTILTYLKAYLFAKQSKGIIYLRIENTDIAREKKDATRALPQVMEQYGIVFDEGVKKDLSEYGNYGPYLQTERKNFYHICAKEMVRRGHAYPCFCSAEQLDAIRTEQKALNVNTGYYGSHARCRKLTLKEIKEKLQKGEKFTLRLRAPEYNKNAMVTLVDEVRGNMVVPQNYMDEVLLKSGSEIPTYAFAHVVDDHFMRTTHVFRGDEWLATWPLHIQMFDMLGFEKPKYIHLSPIMKKEGNSRKKLSKRDGSSLIAFDQKGYPEIAITDYCMTISFSDFEAWREINPNAPYNEFNVQLSKLSVSGALLDWDKINDISKNIIGNWTASQLLKRLLVWAEKYDEEFFKLLELNKTFAEAILNMDRLNPNRVRKDISKYSDISGYLGYMFSPIFDKLKKKDFEILENISGENTKKILQDYIKVCQIPDEQSEWFALIRQVAAKHDFATDMKAYKEDPAKFAGSVADAAGVIRVAVTGRQKTTDLFAIMKVLSKTEVIRRINKFLNML